MKFRFPKIDRNTGPRILNWYKGLRRWKQGSVIGFIVGSVMAGLVYWNPTTFEVGEVVIKLHMVLALPWYLIAYLTLGEYSCFAVPVLLTGTTISIIAFYTLLGMVTGAVQQLRNLYWRWSLT